MKEFLSTTGSIIATYIGTAISLISAIVATHEKNRVKKYKDEIFTRLQLSEFAKLYEKGKKAKEIVSKYSSRNKNTKNGLNESKDKMFITDFLTEINENKHLMKKDEIKTWLSEAKKYLTENKYNDLLFCISDIISELNELNDKSFIK